MFITTILDFYLAQIIDHEQSAEKRKSYLMISLVGNLGLLFFFKYSNFFAHNLQATLGFFGYNLFIPDLLTNLILPAGISFYTFQTLSYILDVYKKECHPEKDFLKFLCFVSFFPHLVAGPLTRHNQLIPQLDHIEKHGLNPRYISGISLFIIGLAKKLMIADPIAIEINVLLKDINSITTIDAWLASIGYSLQIYFDFSGYSEMAIGLGRFFNVELPINFRRPYKAIDPSDFWKRWHISLSQWLRDYLYIPLGGNRCSKLKNNFNLLTTMIVGGFWHGANWTFIIWGFIHGAALILYQNLKIKKNSIIGRLFFLFIILFAWVFFRAHNLNEAIVWISRHFRLASSSKELNYFLMTYIILGISLVIVEPNLVKLTEDKEDISYKWKILLGLLFGISLSLLGKSSIFLYFQF
jgi:alginate O-acetyltransferase complex protein AlgI